MENQRDSYVLGEENLFQNRILNIALKSEKLIYYPLDYYYIQNQYAMEARTITTLFTLLISSFVHFKSLSIVTFSLQWKLLKTVYCRLFNIIDVTKLWEWVSLR